MLTSLNFEIDLGNVERSGKISGYGQAKVLTDEELTLLFQNGFQTERDRALFAICFFTGCRISEALQLRVENLKGGLVTFPKRVVKGKVATKQVEITPVLQVFLDAYRLGEEGDRLPQQGYLFPGRRGSKSGYLTRARADEILGEACDRVGLEGVSTHSFRRTYITKLRDKGYSPAQIQKRTGHRRRENLMHYFDRI
ncbi:site-specific integrase [Leptolyngbya sp. GB1-A1]|uniref:tyrosine-type recombinase/integrase n=1 Tax=Leptolyngbya sp. GB1-A1 TaxID=2933908 RepID=UPI003296E604